jgi:hypothetical protein
MKQLLKAWLTAGAFFIASGAFAGARVESVRFALDAFDWLDVQPEQPAPKSPLRRRCLRRLDNNNAKISAGHPLAHVACVSLACPGVVLLGVGF